MHIYFRFLNMSRWSMAPQVLRTITAPPNGQVLALYAAYYMWSAQNVIDQRQSTITGKLDTLDNRWCMLKNRDDLKPETKWRSTQRGTLNLKPFLISKPHKAFLYFRPRRSYMSKPAQRGSESERGESELKLRVRGERVAVILISCHPSSSSLLQSKGMKNNDSIQLLGFKVDRNRRVL